MSRALDAELRGMGIPFFALRHDLARPPSTPNTNNNAETAGSERIGISMDELVLLQRRMLDLLEDMCTES
jgi:hypothetical protein